MHVCAYFQAHVNRKETYHFVSILRSFDHVCFDRTINPEQGVFEFFVPPAAEKKFLHIMHYFINKNIVMNLKKLPNRLESPDSVF